ncbi:MAG: hypothetical protein K1X40_14385 [Chitinophagales bacterium]|nr:hypothetical protein [Chitinophagales bacterium]HMZ90168.1 hypothetical protein [Chitinophagales bacterium]
MESKQKIILLKKQSNFLLMQPETGMGFQIVDINTKAYGWIYNVVALNSEFIYIDSIYKITANDIKEIKMSQS